MAVGDLILPMRHMVDYPKDLATQGAPINHEVNDHFAGLHN